MRLMSDNDWNSIETAHRKHKDVTLTRQGPGENLIVFTSPGERPWDADTLVGVIHQKDGRGMERKWCATVSEARSYVRHLEGGKHGTVIG